MTITVHCCGEDYYANESHIGAHIRCRRCGRVLTIQPNIQFPTQRGLLGVSSRARKLVVGGLASAFVVLFLIVWYAKRDTQSVHVPTPQITAHSEADPNPLSVEVSKRIPVSLATGTWIIRPRKAVGRGVLKIENGSSLDAVVKLVTAHPRRKTVWMLYVRAHDQKSITGISQGAYLLRFVLGVDWHEEGRRFLRSSEYYQAGKQLDFWEKEPTLEEPGKYTVVEVTLNAVFSGNLPREPISEMTFNEGDAKD